METLSGYGNDWYVIGVDLPVGRLVESASLVVTDTFGVRTLLRPATSTTSGRWGLFRHAMPVDDDEAEGAPIGNLLYVAPRAAQLLVGGVVEQVTLSRDEQANVGWAIEQIVESPLQVGVARVTRGRPTRPATPMRRPTTGWPTSHRRIGSRCCRCDPGPTSRWCWRVARCWT